MKITPYLIITLCTFSILACKHKSKTFKDAIRNESENHADTANTTNSTVGNDKLIVPGKSIGTVTLDEPASTIISQLGKPDFSDAAMGKSVTEWYTDHNKKGYATHVYCTTNMGNDDILRVKAIRVSSPSFKTQNELYAGMMIADMQKLYKLTILGAFKLNGSTRTLYDDMTTGIAFDADRSGNITGITVHQSGESVLNAYIAFFGDVK